MLANRSGSAGLKRTDRTESEPQEKRDTGSDLRRGRKGGGGEVGKGGGWQMGEGAGREGMSELMLHTTDGTGGKSITSGAESLSPLVLPHVHVGPCRCKHATLPAMVHSSERRKEGRGGGGRGRRMLGKHGQEENNIKRLHTFAFV